MPAATFNGCEFGLTAPRRRALRWLAWIALGLVVALVLAAIAITVWWRSGDPQQRLQSLLSTQVGSAVQFQDKPRIGLWPQLQLDSRSLSIADPLAADRTLIAIEGVTASSPWPALLSGNLSALDLSAKRISIELQIDEQGRPRFESLQQLGGSGGGEFDIAALPSLAVGELLVQTEQGEWQLRVSPLRLGHDAAIAESAGALVHTPWADGSGEITLQWLDDNQGLALSLHDFAIEFDVWPESGRIDLRAQLDIENSSLKASYLQWRSEDLLEVEGQGELGWSNGLTTDAGLNIVMTNSLEPLGGQGPTLQGTVNPRFRDGRLEADFSGRLGESTLNADIGICLQPGLRLGLVGKASFFDLADWVWPGTDSGSSSEVDNKAQFETAVTMAVEEFIDESVSATGVLLNWRSNNTTAQQLLLECQP